MNAKRMTPALLLIGSFLIGLPVGLAMRGKPDSRIVESGKEDRTKVGGFVSGSEPADERNTKRERMAQRPDEIGFSLKQWRELQKNPNRFRINVTDCILWKHQFDIPGEMREKFWALFDEPDTPDGGPDLVQLAEFLGLDEKQTLGLREALRGFGEKLRDVEKQSAVSEYTGDGKLRIRFPDGVDARNQAFQELRNESRGLLGPKQFSRFDAVAIPDESADFNNGSFEIGVRFSGAFVRVSYPGGEGIFDSKDADGGELKTVMMLGGNIKRLSHLDLDVDWERLYREANERRGQ